MSRDYAQETDGKKYEIEIIEVSHVYSANDERNSEVWDSKDAESMERGIVNLYIAVDPTSRPT